MASALALVENMIASLRHSGFILWHQMRPFFQMLVSQRYSHYIGSVTRYMQILDAERYIFYFKQKYSENIYRE